MLAVTTMSSPQTVIGSASALRIRSARSTAAPSPVQVLGDDDELVAAEPGDGVSVADDAAQPVGDLREHLVAGGVPEAVVDGLELVEVDEQQPDRAGGAGLAGQRLPDALHEPGPVRAARSTRRGRPAGPARLRRSCGR